jgi:prepilin-type N-terminal cleavage/methylation domain-containing protein
MSGLLQRPRGQRGFTLIELLVASALTVLVVAGAVTFYSSSLLGWSKMSERAGVQQHARIAVDEIVNELVFATGVWVDCGRQEVRYRKIKDGAEAEYMFYLLGSQLCLKLPEGTAVPIANYIQCFVEGPEGEVEAGEMVNLLVRAEGQGGTVELRSGVWPRNIGRGGLNGEE